MGAVRNSGFQYGHVNRMLPEIPAPVQSQKEAATSQTSAKKQAKKQITNNYTSLFFQTIKRFLPLQKI